MQQFDKNAIFQMRFPQKLWYLINKRTDAVLWGGTGRTILLNYRILHNYLQCDNSIFKTTNISSFVRQLNLYGFRKVTSHLQDPLCNSSNPYMHEYVHDYFQYGRPELLNKISRKALALRKHFKPKNIYENTDQLSYITPLQKARRALHIALRKAAQDLFIQDSPKQFCNLKFECEENPDDFCEDEENLEFDWIIPEADNVSNNETETQPEFPPTATENEQVKTEKTINEDTSNYEEPPQDLMNYEPQQNNDNFSGQFLSMPDLDAEPAEETSGVELLAEFNIDHEQDVTGTLSNQDGHGSLNCVLPSISNDHIDDVTIAENNNDNSDHYHDGEWDQMFNDLIASKGSNQECGTEFKELYSQISRTIDLLNS